MINHRPLILLHPLLPFDVCDFLHRRSAYMWWMMIFRCEYWIKPKMCSVIIFSIRGDQFPGHTACVWPWVDLTKCSSHSWSSFLYKITFIKKKKKLIMKTCGELRGKCLWMNVFFVPRSEDQGRGVWAVERKWGRGSRFRVTLHKALPSESSWCSPAKRKATTSSYSWEMFHYHPLDLNSRTGKQMFFFLLQNVAYYYYYCFFFEPVGGQIWRPSPLKGKPLCKAYK